MLVYEQAFHKLPAVDYLRKKSSEKEKVSAVAGSAGVNRPYSFIKLYILADRFLCTYRFRFRRRSVLIWRFVRGSSERIRGLGSWKSGGLRFQMIWR